MSVHSAPGRAGQNLPGQANHPLAPRMAIIAIASQNFILGPIFGGFGVMLGPAVQRLGVSTAQAALGISVVFISSSLLASPIGVLVSRFSLRLMLLLGAALAIAAFVLLAFTTSYAGYLLAYALLLGPAMSLAGMVGPSTLVTRWFKTHGGLVQGLVYLPVMVAIMPLLANWVVEHDGARAAYLMMAAMIGGILVPLLLFVIDFPPGEQAPVAAGHETTAGSLTVGEFLVQPRFWALALAAATVTGGSTTLGSILIPMAESWHVDRSSAALLITVMSSVGMAGSVLFGWVADRVGGSRGLVILTFSSAVLWFLLAQPLPFAALVGVIAVQGLCAAGTVPNLSRAVAETWGPASFSRGFGLAMTVGLPLNVLVVPLFPWIRAATGSYLPAMFGLSGLLVLAFLLALFASRRPRVARADALA